MPELDVDALLTASQAAQYAGVKVSTICKWRERGHLPPAVGDHGQELRDDHGRRLYRLLDVAKAEHATALRAQTIAQRITRGAA